MNRVRYCFLTCLVIPTMITDLCSSINAAYKASVDRFLYLDN